MSDRSQDSDKLFEEIQQAAQLQPNSGPAKQENADYQRWSIPNYSILNEIHRGGQGVVFKAVQESTKRIVALKFILHGSFATERQRFRFEREIDLASRLNHPNIVTIFDGGVANKQPYCAMEFVDGKPLDEFVNNFSLSKTALRENVELFKKICSAVGYAHSRGVIHRDLKPANILVGSNGEPHVLDFGLAKVLDSETIAGYSPRTMTGEFIGTLSYASPEQAQANPELTDTRSDVYSLGVVFYELITGRLPYDVSGSITDTLNNISSSDPIRPTSAIGGLDLEIETILLKSLSKDPERRYQNATQMADDLQRYLDGKPIDARRDSSWYVLKKNVIRHKRVVIAAASFVSLLIISLIAISIFYIQAVHDRDMADEARRLESEQREQAEFRSYIARLAASDASQRNFDFNDALHNLTSAPETHRAFEWRYLLGLIDQSEASLGGHGTGVLTIDHHPQNKWIVTGGQDGFIRFWLYQPGELHGQMIGQHSFGKPVQCVRVHPDGERVAVGFVDGDAVIAKVATLDGGPKVKMVIEEWPTISTEGARLHELEFTPDGGNLIIASGTYPQPGIVYVYDSNTAGLVRKFAGHEHLVWTVAVSPDGKRIASADNKIKIWNVTSGAMELELDGHPPNWLTDLSFDPSGRWLVSAANDQEIRIWDLETGRHDRSFFGHSGAIDCVEFSPDGKILASLSRDRTLRTWDAQTTAPLSTRIGHVEPIPELSFDPQGAQIATAGRIGSKIWLTSPKATQPIGPDYHREIADVEISPNSCQLLVADLKGNLVEWDLKTRKVVQQIRNSNEAGLPINSVSYSRNGEFIAWAQADDAVYLQNRDSTTTRRLVGHQGSVTAVDFAAKNTLYSSSDDGTVRRWEANLLTSEVFCESPSPIKKVIISNDGKWVATTTTDEITIWDAKTKNQVSQFPRKVSNVVETYEMVFSPDGKTLAAHDQLSNFSVWEIPSGKKIVTRENHLRDVLSISYTPDGRRLVTASLDETVKFWDTKWYQLVFTIRTSDGAGRAIDFAPDSDHLVGGMYGGIIRIWNSNRELR